MSFANKFREKLENIRKSAIEHLPLVDRSVRESRLEICNSCEFLFKPTNSCKKCGCFVDAKTWIPSTECPINKWSSAETAKNSNVVNGQ